MATILESSLEVNSKGFDKTRYLVELDGKRYYAIDWDGLYMPVVYNEALHSSVKSMNWSVAAAYAQYNGLYMHRFVYTTATGQDPRDDGLTIDHINEFKLDNRMENLRSATQSQQNANRASRKDKLPPPIELVQAGVTELPRYVRWDGGESKLVIEKHPELVNRVSDGKQKKAVMSGSKSAKLTVVQKYQDILARLSELDRASGVITEVQEFGQKKRQLGDEYVAIVRAIRGESFEDPRRTIDDAPIEAHKTTAAGRKKPSTLPPNCGVTVEMLPPYTCYVKATDKRGDKFELNIDRQYRWSTTGSTGVTTKRKYEMLMEHIETLPDNLRTRLRP
jgi:hypothetical protein